MNKQTKSILVALSIASSALPLTTVSASEFKYDAVEIFYSKISFKDTEFLTKGTFNGYGIKGTYSVTPSVVVGGTYGVASAKSSVRFTNDTNRTSADIDSTGATVFAFYHREIMPKADIQIGASYTKLDQEVKAGSTVVTNLSGDDTSKSILGGVRYQVNDKIEAGVTVDYDLDADDDKFSFDLEARYQVADDIDVGLSFSPDSDGDTIAINLRKYFDFH